MIIIVRTYTGGISLKEVQTAPSSLTSGPMDPDVWVLRLSAHTYGATQELRLVKGVVDPLPGTGDPSRQPRATGDLT